MKNTPAEILPGLATVQQEVELNLPDINKQLILKSFEGIVAFKPEYTELVDEYTSYADDFIFGKLQHELIDLYPAILNVQIRDLFTLQGKNKGRYRLRQLGEVYRTIAHLLSAIALSCLWDAVINKTNDSDFKIASKHLSLIRQYIHSPARFERTVGHFKLLQAVCSVFKSNKTGLYVEELLSFNKQLSKTGSAYLAYQFFETDFCPRFQKDLISDNEVPAVCQKVEEELGQLMKASSFLVNYEIIRVKDVRVNYLQRKGKPQFIHEKAHINGREYPTVDPMPITSATTSNNHAIFLSNNTKEDQFSLNLSPFVIDQNTFKGKKHYLPKIYFFSGIDKEKHLHFAHIDTPSLDFVLDDENVLGQYAYLNQINNNILAFCQDLSLSI